MIVVDVNSQQQRSTPLTILRRQHRRSTNMSTYATPYDYEHPLDEEALHEDGDHDHEEDDIKDGEELDEDLEWDEGGPSQCGYSESIHSVLMSAGAAVHGVVGDPGEGMHTTMRRIGNFFQEASYAVRDVVRGDHADVRGDAHQAFKEMVGASDHGGDMTGVEHYGEDEQAGATGQAPPLSSSYA